MRKRHVVLIGDSIRIGYRDIVARELADVADVWGPQENGGTTPNVLVSLHAWVLNRQPPPDLVHINAGLHDLKTIHYGGRQNVVPLAHYRRNVETIPATIREALQPPAARGLAKRRPVRASSARLAPEAQP